MTTRYTTRAPLLVAAAELLELVGVLERGARAVSARVGPLVTHYGEVAR